MYPGTWTTALDQWTMGDMLLRIVFVCIVCVKHNNIFQ